MPTMLAMTKPAKKPTTSTPPKSQSPFPSPSKSGARWLADLTDAEQLALQTVCDANDEDGIRCKPDAAMRELYMLGLIDRDLGTRGASTHWHATETGRVVEAQLRQARLARDMGSSYRRTIEPMAFEPPVHHGCRSSNPEPTTTVLWYARGNGAHLGPFSTQAEATLAIRITPPPHLGADALCFPCDAFVWPLHRHS